MSQSVPLSIDVAVWNGTICPNEGTLNLTTNQTWNVAWRDDDGSENTASRTYYPATYFNYIGAAPHPTSPTDAANTAAKFGGRNKTRKRPVSKSRRANGLRASASSCSYNEEIQNFANWYTHYRSRILTARAGTGEPFSKQGTEMRVGFAAINKAAATLDGISTRTIVSGVRAFFRKRLNLVFQPSTTTHAGSGNAIASGSPTMSANISNGPTTGAMGKTPDRPAAPNTPVVRTTTSR